MRLILVHLIFFLIVLSPGISFASRAIFFQPQERDLEIPPANWPVIFNGVRERGIDTLIIQWTGFGDTFANKSSQQWIKNRLEDALTSKLSLIIGLQADPDIFSRLEQPLTVLPDYFRKLRQRDVTLAQYWLSLLPPDKITGWYIPLEIDDRRWRDESAFEVLQNHIQSETQALQTIGDKPVFISSFFAGNMSPSLYTEMLKKIKTTSSTHILVQDGAGTEKLSVPERQLYLGALSNCDAPVADGIVYEIFKQTQHDREFKAQSLPSTQLDEKMNVQAPCGKKTVYFSLRYLIDLNNPLKTQ